MESVRAAHDPKPSHSLASKNGLDLLTTKTVALLFCPTLDSTLLSHREHTFGHRNFLLTQGELMLQQCQRFLSDAQFFFQGLGGLGSDFSSSAVSPAWLSPSGFAATGLVTS
jgi:hypothetical protein